MSFKEVVVTAARSTLPALTVMIDAVWFRENSVCLKSFSEKTLLQDHLDKQHRVNEDGFSCNFCSRYFYRHLPPQSNVTLHL